MKTRSAATCFCAIGAIDYVEGFDPGVEDNYAALKFLARFVGGNIPRFNDAPGRTQAEVVAKLREAAALARKEGR